MFLLENSCYFADFCAKIVQKLLNVKENAVSMLIQCVPLYCNETLDSLRIVAFI